MKRPCYIKAIMTLVVIFVFSCIGFSSKQDSGLDAAGVATNNRGVALMGQFEYEEARKVFEELVQKYPGNPDLQTNLAIATFNRQKENDEQLGLSMLSKVLESDPGHLRAQYCSGLLKLHMGHPEKALEYFLSVIKTDPGDAEAFYFTGKTLLQLSRYKEALDYFKRSLSRDPYIRSNYYGMIMALRQMGKTEDVLKIMKEFQRMKNNPGSRLMEFKYTRMGRKSEALAVDQADARPVEKPSGLLFKPVKTIAGGVETSWRHREDGGSIRSSITICDINGDNQPDIFISGAVKTAAGYGNAVLWGNAAGETYTFAKGHPLAKVTGVNAALWGDVNEDGLMDVYLCRQGPNQLLYQVAPDKWQDMTGNTGTGSGDFDTVDGALFDADHDGDLDIFLVNADGPNELLNNNRNGTFRPLAADYGLSGTGKTSVSVVITDIDTDRDADLIVINRQPPHEVYKNERLWKYHWAKGFEKFVSADIKAAVAGDVNADGRTEIYTLDSKAILSRWQADPGGSWTRTVLPLLPQKNRSKTPAAPDIFRLALADVDGDGVTDVIVPDAEGWRVASFAGSHIKSLFTVLQKEKTGLAAWSVINSLRGPYLLGWGQGKPPLLWTPGLGRYAFAALKLAGKEDPNSQWRSNASGIGTRLSVRVGSRWTVLDTFRDNSGPGQGLQPVIVGLAGKNRLDFVTFDWPDGVFQTELDLAAGKIHRITETQRQLSSCPVLFAWNGKTFAFVSDFLGVGGIGYAVGPGEYTEPRPWENFLLPRGLLQPQNGRLILKLTEPMEEVAYLDAVQLKAYDLPPGWSMTLDERMGINEPAPTGLPRFYRNILIPSKAINDRREDVTAVVAARDLQAAPPGNLDRRFVGRLQQDHVLTVTFPRPLDSFPGQAVLLADGWVEYPYSQTNFAAWQAGADYRAPTIEVRLPNGQWKVLLEQFGYPAGMPRQMSVPLPGLPKGVHQLRITTNQEIYWDRLAVVFTETCPEVRRHEPALESAFLEQVGFPRRIDRGQRLPYYDYEKRRPFWDTHFIEGYYTRFGGVEELVTAKDNAVVIFGAGEGVHMEFRDLSEPPGEGWTRVYVIETHGWCKDMDLYTRTGDTIDPVPSRGKRDRRVDRLHRLYNTRYLSGRE